MLHGGTRRLLVGFLVLGVAVGVSAGCAKVKPRGSIAFGTAVSDEPRSRPGAMAPDTGEPSKPGGDSAKRIKEDTVLEVPFIFWGGDVATFHANGGLETTPDSLFGKQGLKLKLVPGDDFAGQVKNYSDNKSPFLRGTMSMLGQESEGLTKKPDTTPVVFL